eukprot:5660318-Prymnesium_polylepis.1
MRTAAQPNVARPGTRFRSRPAEMLACRGGGPVTCAPVRRCVERTGSRLSVVSSVWRQRRVPRYRRVREGGALRPLLRLLQHPAPYVCRRARLPAGHCAGSSRALIWSR